MNCNKKIIIISDEEDYSTSVVIDWLLYFNEDFYRINERDFICIENLKIDKELNFELKISFFNKNKIETIKSNEIKSIWYRRGRLNLEYELFSKIKLPYELKREIDLEFKNQCKSLKSFLNLEMFNPKDFKVIGNEIFNKTNKLHNLRLAKQIGLEIPTSYMISTKSELKKILSNEKELISKPITQGSAIGYKSRLKGFTVLINSNDLFDIPDYFPLTLFQEKLEKEFEIRVFYLMKKTYSVAIFSQNDEQTKVDFRNYNNSKPNRTPPFKLPQNVEKRIVTFMEKLNLNSGSIDMIYDKKERFIFLEVNPIGQFHQVSYPANYNLNKIIAKELC